MLSKEHKDLAQKWCLDVDDQLCSRLLDGDASSDDVHKALQLWRKINANNMLRCLRKRSSKVVESRFQKHISMPAKLPEVLDRYNAIAYPSRLADMDLLAEIAGNVIVAPPVKDDIKPDILQHGYVTVSHVWVDGKMDVKAPLCESVLADLEAKYIWMDKICIDQDNADEVSAEVAGQSGYYRTAPLCLLAASVSSESIIEMDNDIARLWSFHEIIESQTESSSKLSYGMVSAYRERMDKLIGRLSRNGVLHHQWFTRVWTLPEMSVTQDLIVSNGEEYAYMTPLIELISKYGHVKSREMFADEGIAECFHTLRIAGGHEKFTLSEAIESCSGRACTIEEDKIYALTGMVPDIVTMPVKYGIGLEKALSLACRLAYANGDVSWMLNTTATNKGFPTFGTRFLCPLTNDKLWLDRKHVKIYDSGITVSGSVHAIESWTNIHEMGTICRNGRLSSDVALWSNLLVHASSDIKELMKLTGWIGTASQTTFGLVLVVVFHSSKPMSGLSVVIPSCVKNGIVTVLVMDNGKKVHIGRSVIVGSGIVRHTEDVSVV